MSPTPEELELGEKAYKQVRFYENVTVKDLRKTPWVYVILAGLLFLALILDTHPIWPKDFPLFLVVPIVYLMLRRQHQMDKAQYATQKLLLQLLEEKYGDALPWVVEKKQLSAARELEAAIAQGQHPASHT